MAESLFTSQTPVIADASDGTPGISTATTLRFAVDGTVSAIRFRSTTTVGGTYTGELWRVDANDNTPAGTKLASAVLGETPSGGAWVEIPISPVSVVTNTLYRAVVHNNQGRYVATLNLFDSTVTNGNLTADAHTSNPIGLGTLNQGTFAISATANVYPSNEGSGGTCYFVDVVFNTGGTTHTATAAGASTSGGAAAVSVRLGAASTGASTTGGVAAVTVRLAAGASGTSTTAGAAAAGLRLAAGASGGSTTAGSAAATVAAATIHAATAAGASTSSGTARAALVGLSVKAASTPDVTSLYGSTPVLSARTTSTSEVTRG